MADVENKIVSLKLDNRQFEDAALKSIDTLGKLEKSMQIKGDPKAIQNFKKELNTFSVMKLQASIDSLTSKFSIMGIVGTTALVKISNAAIDAATNFAKSFTTKPFHDGLNEYNLKLDKMRIIMSSTGKPIGDVKKALGELNDYADKTIYSFRDMTDSVSKFTNQEIPLERATAAIKGVAQVAALAGASKEEMSRAMFQISQAMSKDFFAVEDWRSIENANMSTVALKKTLLETAAEMGILKKTAEGTYEGWNALSNKSYQVTTSNFRGMLNNGFLTRDVFLKTMEKFTDENTELGKAAYRAASEVRSFGKLVDVTMESIGSGWAEVFEYVIGDLEEAASMWTNAGIFLSDKTNEFFEGLKKQLGAWRAFGGRANFIKGITNLFEALGKVLKVVKFAFEEVFSFKWESLVSFSKGFEELTSGLILSEEAVSALKDILVPFLRIIKLGKDILIGVVKLLFKFADALSPLGKIILAAGQAVGKFISSVLEALDKARIIEQITNGLAYSFGWLKDVLTGIGASIADILHIDALSSLKKSADGIKSFLSEGGNSKLTESLTDAFRKLSDSIEPAMSDIKGFMKAAGSGISSALAYAITAISSALASLINFLRDIPWSKIGDGFKMVSGGAFHAAKSVWDFIKALAKMAVGIDPGESLKRLGEGFVNFSNAVVKSFKGTEIGKGISIALHKIRVAIKEIGTGKGTIDKLIYAFKELFKILTLKNIAKLLDSMGGKDSFFNLIKKIPESITSGISHLFDSLAGSIKNFTSKVKSDTLKNLAISIALLTASIWVLSTIDENKLKSSLVGLAVGIGTILGSMSVLSKITVASKSSIPSVIASLIALSIAVKIFAKAVKILGSLSFEEIFNGLIGLMGILLSLAGVSYIMNKLNTEMVKASFGIIFLGAGIWVLAQAVKVLSDIPFLEMISGLSGVAVIMAVLAGAVNLMGTPKGFIKLSIAVGIMAGSLYLLGKSLEYFGTNENVEVMIVSFIALAGAIAILGTLAKNFTTNMLLLAGSLAAVGASILVLSAALFALGSLDTEKLAKSLLSFAFIMSVMVLAMRALNVESPKGGAAFSAASFIALALAMNLMVRPLVRFSKLSWEGIVKGLFGLAISFGALWAAAVFLAPMAGGIMALSRSVALLGAGLVLAGIGVTLFSVGLAALVGIAASAAVGLVKSAQIIGRMAAESIKGFVIGIAENKQHFTNAFVALIEIAADTLSAASVKIVEILVNLLSAVIQAAVKLIPELANAVVEILIGVLNAVSSRLPEIIEAARPIAEAIFEAIKQLVNTGKIDEIIMSVGKIAVLMYALSFIKSLAVNAMIGLVFVGLFLVELAAVLAAFGALNKIPGVGELIDSGGELLTKIAYIIGDFVGSLVGGFIDGATSGLPNAANNISKFFENLEPMFEFIRGTTQEEIDRIGLIAKALLIITAAEFLQGLSNLLGMGKIDLSGFGEELVAFAKPFKKFSQEVKNLPKDTVDKSIIVAEAMTALLSVVPREGGLLQKIIGEKMSLSKLGEQLKDFAPDFVEYSKTISGLDVEVVNKTADAVSTVIELSKEMPNTGGVWQEIVGEKKNMGFFGVELVSFALAMVAYSDVMANLNEGVVETTKDAVLTVIELNKQLPNTGGLWQMISGEANFGIFGERLVSFSKSFATYALWMSIVPDSVVEKSAKAAGAIVAIASQVPETGGLWGMLAGDGDMSDFGENLVDFGEYFSEFAERVDGLGSQNLTNAIAAFAEIVNVSVNLNGLDISKVKGFADALGSMAKGGIKTFVDSFENATDKFYKAPADAIQAAIDAVEAKKNIFRTSIQGLLLDGSDLFKKSADFVEAGEMIVRLLMHGIKKNIVNLQGVLKELTRLPMNSFVANSEEFVKIGVHVTEGIALGVEYGAPKLDETLINLAKRSVKVLRDTYGIKSPAQWVAQAVGVWIPLGQSEGVKKSAPKMWESMKSHMASKEEMSKIAVASSQNAEKAGEQTAQGYAKGVQAGSKEVKKAIEEIQPKKIDNKVILEIRKEAEEYFQNTLSRKRQIEQLELTGSYAEFETPYITKKAEDLREKRWRALNDEQKLQRFESEQLHAKIQIAELSKQALAIDADISWRTKVKQKELREQQRDDEKWEVQKKKLFENVNKHKEDIARVENEIKTITDTKKLAESRRNLETWKEELKDLLLEVSNLDFTEEERLRNKETKNNEWEATLKEAEIKRQALIDVEVANFELRRAKHENFHKNKIDFAKEINSRTTELKNLQEEYHNARQKEDEKEAARLKERIMRLNAANEAQLAILAYIKAGGNIQEMQVKELAEIQSAQRGQSANIEYASKGADLANSFKVGFDVTALETLVNSGKVMVDHITKGLNSKKNELLSAARLLCNNILNEFEILMYKYREAGQSIMDHIILGLMDKANEMQEKVQEIMTNAINNASMSAEDQMVVAFDGISENMESWSPNIKPVLRFDYEMPEGVVAAEYERKIRITPPSENALRGGVQTNEVVNNITKNYNYSQNNYSPKALNSAEIYRQTKSQMSTLRDIN